MNKDTQISILDDSEVKKFITTYPEWVHVDGTLQAHYEFADFEDAMAVVTALTSIITEMNHHPFWSNEYNKLSFILSTHEHGNQVTQLDTGLAKAISELIKNAAG